VLARSGSDKETGTVLCTRERTSFVCCYRARASCIYVGKHLESEYGDETRRSACKN